MAGVVVEFVLKNLADFIVKEAQFLGGVGEKVEQVKRDLIRIKCCLKDADSKKKGNEGVQNWLNDLRDVAYRIADATDTYFLPVEDHHQKEASSFLQKLKKVFKKPMKLPNLHKLGTELDEIQNLLQDIHEKKDHFRIKDQPLEEKSKGEAVIMPRRTATYSDVDETQVVGMQADKDEILKLLRREHTTKLAVITIVGAGGLGKTTLACTVYKSATGYFDYDIMLSISQQFNLTDLLIKMIRKFNDSVPTDRDVDYYARELKSFLSRKRYLIILDDVWEDDVWKVLKGVLPSVNKNGSRILITSRSIEVEKSAEYQMIQYELKILDDGESLDLLLRKALPDQDPKEYPTNLLELARKLSKKCQGLPLALVVLGGILSKQPSYPTWERMLENMNWHSDGKDCMRIVAMSYEDLPYYLKACFQYLAFFPEDYVISGRCLMRMWVAEGFIPLEGRETMEIMAEDCLEELAKRSLVQVLSRSTNGLIKQFKVHDILRELAMKEAGHENFVTVFSQASADNKPEKIIRRVSLQAQEKNSQFTEYVGSNTRSLFLFDTNGYFKTSLDCSNFRLLKVLEVVGKHGDELVLEPLDELIHLKYLRLSDCKIKCPASFRRMKRLETLELRGSKYRHCDGLWTISTLRHVLVDYWQDIPELPKGTPISNLQTLKWVKFQDVCDAKLPHLRTLGIENLSGEWVSMTNLFQTLRNLRTLGIKNYSEKWESMTNLFQTLRNLRKFEIHCYSKIPKEIVYPNALPEYQNLQSLYLEGKWEENNVNVEARLFPPYLIKLSLKGSRLNQNPMPELGKLNSLKKLCLGEKVLTDDWEDPINCQEGFPALQYFTMDYWTNIKDLTVAQGVMPKLTYLKIGGPRGHALTTKVHLPPELQHVTVQTW